MAVVVFVLATGLGLTFVAAVAGLWQQWTRRRAFALQRWDDDLRRAGARYARFDADRARLHYGEIPCADVLCDCRLRGVG